jgi:peptidyl-prolyl cis-trans isomerase A (cyclophilin A)
MRLVLVVMCAASFVSVIQAADSPQAEDKAPAAPNKAEAQDPPVAEQKEKTPNPVVKVVTTKGDIQIELNIEKAPITVANFLKYSESGFYEGTIFHRVIKDFMIQGGGFTPDMQQKKTEPPIKNESGNKLRNNRGTIAMARTTNPDSATSQFFINHKDNQFLNGSTGKPGYAVFGKVIAGMDVVDAIAAVPTRQVGSQGTVPVEPVVIKSVTVIEIPIHENNEEGHDEHAGHDGDHDKSEHGENDND